MTTPHYDRETLTDYLHGALTPAADAAVFAHLDACPPCTATYEEEAALTEALRSAARAEEFEFPSMVKARVWDAVRNEQPSWFERLRAWTPRLAVPVAAVIAIGAYFGTPIWRHPPIAGVQAAVLLDEHNAQAQQNPFGPGSAPAVYGDAQDRGASATAASYIDAADAATLDDARGAFN